MPDIALFAKVCKERRCLRVRDLLRERFNGDRKAFYEAAGLNRRLFSKMISYEGYTPSKETVIAIALAVQLTLPLSDSLPADIVHAFCYSNQIYRREQVRALLDEFAGGNR